MGWVSQTDPALNERVKLDEQRMPFEVTEAVDISGSQATTY